MPDEDLIVRPEDRAIAGLLNDLVSARVHDLAPLELMA